MQFTLTATVTAKYSNPQDANTQFVLWEIDGVGLRRLTDKATADLLVLGQTYDVVCTVTPRP